MSTIEEIMAKYNRYDDYLRRKMDYAASLPEFGIGKMFSVVVADGKAFYEVIAVTDTTATVEIVWPEDEADDDIVGDYVDPFIGAGGTFERERIEALTARCDTIARIFS